METLLALLAAALGVMAWLHVSLDALLNVETFSILDRLYFRLLHQWYLNISELQWGRRVCDDGLDDSGLARCRLRSHLMEWVSGAG